MKSKSFIKITNIVKLLEILLFIGVLITLIIQIRKVYILTNTYSKYEKSIVAEVLNSEVQVPRKIRGKYHGYLGSLYTIYIDETNETIKITTNPGYMIGEKILLSYYNLYDKNSNKYCGQNYSITKLSYFNNGSFYETLDNSYIFCNPNYIDKTLGLKIDYPDDRIVEKDYIRFYTDSHNVTCKLSNISSDLINVIKNRTTSIDVTETSLGNVYNFEYYTFYFSVLNYGKNINESLVLQSTSKKNIIDFITNISL